MPLPARITPATTESQRPGFRTVRGRDVRIAQADAARDGQKLTFQPSLDTDAAFAQGRVALASTDPLAIDDARYFTVAVDALPKLLLVTPRPDDVFELQAALLGDEEAGVSGRYEMTTVSPTQFTADRLAGQDVVCLVNVPSLNDGQWGDLERFVREGGGLAVMLGALDVDPLSYNRAAAQAVLPTRLDVYGSRPGRDPARLIFESTSHPLVERLAATYESDSVLETADILRFWRVEPTDAARVLARYTYDGLPALLERRLGRGLVTVLTTAIDIKPRRQSWNNLPQVDGAEWVYVVLMDQWMRHLARSGEGELNFLAGQTPRMTLPEELVGQSLRLNTPDLKTLPVPPTAEGSPVLLADAIRPGHYSVVTAGGQPVYAFSVNGRPEEADLTRAADGDLVSLFGEENFTVARDLLELSEEIDLARFGQEAFPAMLLLTIAFFAGETLLASRFYGEE